jgi:hypothetical protein
LSKENAAAKQLFGLMFVIAAAVPVEDLHMNETQEREYLGRSGFLPIFSAPCSDDVVSDDGGGLVLASVACRPFLLRRGRHAQPREKGGKMGLDRRRAQGSGDEDQAILDGIKLRRADAELPYELSDSFSECRLEGYGVLRLAKDLALRRRIYLEVVDGLRGLGVK